MMEFRETVQKIDSFYKEYDKIVLEVDGLFDIIDENAGQISNELEEIQKRLRYFWNSWNNRDNNLNETAEDENFLMFSIRLEHQGIKESELMSLCKEIQSYFRNYSAVDSKPIVHVKSDDVIEKVFESLKTIENYETAFAITKILYELVTDDLLVRCGISQLYKWNYGTDAFSLLTAEEQLVVILNQSIMIDRLHSGHHLLKTYLNRLNKVLSGFEHLDWTVYYVAGFLNFKIHNYRESKQYFDQVEKNTGLLSSNLKDQKRYFHACLLIAYGYEYEGRFGEAIEKIVKPVSDVLNRLESVHPKEFDNLNYVISLLNEFSNSACENSLFYTYFHQSRITITDQVSNPKNKDSHNMHIEILHALAHCLNEYAIQNYKSNIEGCSKLIRFSRALMRLIANINCEYWTCYATIHGEHKDYDIALQELSNAENRICESKQKSKLRESLSAEINFFRYYFGQMLNKEVNQEKNQFSSYCIKYSDDDAYSHLQIFEFRSKLKNYLSDFFDYLRKNNRRSDAINNLPSTESIDKAHENVCKLHPSPYMNINVRAELRIMQRIYTILIRLNDYIVAPSEYNTKRLLNACRRFCNTKKEFGLVDVDDQIITEVHTDTFLPSEVYNVLFAKGGIVHSLNSLDSVFVLAPISGIVVYQYQTGTIDSLFDVSTLMEGRETFEKGINYSQTRPLMLVYRNTVLEDRQFVINGVTIDDFASYGVKCISLWSSDAPGRLLQLDHSLGMISRRLTDYKSFEKVLKEYTQNDNEICESESRFNMPCQVSFCKLPWLEIVNETESDQSFLIFRKTDGPKVQYIILSGYLHKEDQCDLHSLLKNVEEAPASNKSIRPNNGRTSVNSDLLTKEIRDTKESIERKEKEREGKLTSIRNYDDQQTRSRTEKEIETLNKELSVLHDKMSTLLKKLFSVFTQEEAKNFCITNSIEYNKYI